MMPSHRAIWMVLLMAGSMGILSAQATATADSTADRGPAPLPATFYAPPDMEQRWADIKRRVQGADGDKIDRAWVVNLLDSLAADLQSDIDTLVERSRAFDGMGGGGYTHQLFRSPMTRDDILGDPISRETAAEVPHFHAIYGPQGHLLRVTYVEPRIWRARQEALAQRKFQAPAGSVPLVRYFKQWDIRQLSGRSYVRKKKRLENRSYYRALYNDEDLLQEVQRYNEQWQLIYTLDFRRQAAEGSRYALLNFGGDGSGSLLDVHPYVFIPDYSLVKPGWKVAITSSDTDELQSVQILNHLGEISYYYTYSSSLDEETGKRTLRCTALSEDEEVLQVFSVTYDKKNRMERRTFFTINGDVTESITFSYRRRSDQILAVTRNAAGIVTGQRTFVDAALTE